MQPLFIFISYSRQDTTIANELARLLERGGHDPFIDRELLPGQHWKTVLQKQIDRCDAFVYALSPDALDSEWCQWEYQEAVRQNKPIFPIKVRDFTTFPEAVKSVGDIQMLDMTQGITSDTAAALMGGLFHVREISPKTEAVPTEPSRAALRANPKSNPIQFDSVLKLDEHDSNDNTEPLIRLPMPLKNPLPNGVRATLKIVESPTLPLRDYRIYTTRCEIGRSSKVDLQIKEKRISKQHATLYWSNGKFRITDNSLNGTWLNGERLTSNQSYTLAPDFDHHIDLSGNYTILSFRYSVEETDNEDV